MSGLTDKLIVALDVDTLKKAQYFVDRLYPKVKFFKIGSQLFTACGPEAVSMVGKKNAKVFLDLKFHDIPKTVYSAVATGTASSILITSTSGADVTREVKDVIAPPVFMMTVHISGGKEMLIEAVKGAAEKAQELHIKKPFIIGVTRLTSDKNNDNIQRDVLEAARLAKNAGLDGVVCAAHETQIIREEFGQDFIIVNPGIRPKGYPSDDQSRIATAKEALAAGASFIVVGRPILEADNPLGVIEDMAAE